MSSKAVPNDGDRSPAARRGRTPLNTGGDSSSTAFRKKANRRRTTRSSVSVDTYRDDPLYPKIVRATASLLESDKVVAPLDVLIRMQLLAPRHLEDWRRGRIPYLERVIQGNLTRLSRLLRILRFHAHDLNLTPSWTEYIRRGKGPKQRLRFTKSGELKLEEVYATHFVWPGKGPFHLPGSE